MKLTGKCKANRIECRGTTESGRPLPWGTRNLAGTMYKYYDESLGEDYYNLTTNSGHTYDFSQDQILHNMRIKKLTFTA